MNSKFMQWLQNIINKGKQSYTNEYPYSQQKIDDAATVDYPTAHDYIKKLLAGYDIDENNRDYNAVSQGQRISELANPVGNLLTDMTVAPVAGLATMFHPANMYSGFRKGVALGKAGGSMIEEAIRSLIDKDSAQSGGGY